MCLWYVNGLIDVTADLHVADGRILSIVWNGVLPGLFLISYVINIGFSQAWKKWPAIVSVCIFLAIGVLGYLTEDSFQTVMLARVIWSWELYLFLHLGIAFVVSGVIATPGCEMRAFHDLYSRLTGVPTKEHYCPVGPLHPIDQWEAGRSRN